MQYHGILGDILITENFEEKCEKFKMFYNKYLNNEINLDFDYEPIILTKPSYSKFCKVVHPNDVNQRKRFDTIEGKIELLHTIAHIEYSAIDLALDAALRFKNMPRQYYDDWLEVANDEVRHFQMITKLLENFGVQYGDKSVHQMLFDMMQKTTTLLERMAVVPRYLEANGLEQNPIIMEKLKSNPDEINLQILDALQVILDEEITHVYKGDRWFKYECDKLYFPYEQTYLDIVEKFFPKNKTKNRKLNFEARKKAGFSCDELKVLSNQSECE